MKSIERVTGIKKFKGEIEGKMFDSTTVYIETPLDVTGGNRRGHCTSDFSAGSSEVYDRLADAPLPGHFEVQWATVTNGNRTRQVIKAIAPYKAPTQAQATTPANPPKPGVGA